MTPEICPVQSVEQAARNIYVLTFISERIAGSVRAGQFVNVRPDDRSVPLLRRPFSIYAVEGNRVQLIFHVVGRGTALLSGKREGDTIDVLGPLGQPFNLDDGPFETAALIAGGLGVAPLPLAARRLRARGTRVVTLLGARTASVLVDRHFPDAYLATDDGSRGFRGNVVDLAERTLSQFSPGRMKIFSCGPIPMLRALQAYALRAAIPCDASLEGVMGCGFGICQGCPVELVNSSRKYALMCKDGPVFDMASIRI